MDKLLRSKKWLRKLRELLSQDPHRKEQVLKKR